MEVGAERVVVVMRHAQAESFAREDRLRELTERGREQAADSGRWLAERGIQVDGALISSAVRTQQTWDELRLEVRGTYEDALYAGGTDTVMECLRCLDPDVRTVLFVGHNPTAALLLQMLHDTTGDQDLLVQLAAGFPPASVGVLAFRGDWCDLDYGTARLVDLRVRH